MAMICGNSFADTGNKDEIYFAGGCFWGVEEYFSRIPGVLDAESGYANSAVANPDYKQVCSGRTGAAETVRIAYDPKLVSLQTLVRQLFKIIDPFSVNKQGNDTGTQYRTGIYYSNPADKDILERLIKEMEAEFSRPVAVELLPLANFYAAEDYHQDYLKKNPGGYCHINFDSLKDIPPIVDAGKYPLPADSELQGKLSKEEYDVVRHGATERAFSGKYWNNKAKGIYVDIATGEPLFASSDKFDSGTGWPSFTRPIDPSVIRAFSDNSHGMRRIEVRSRSGGSHLGHVFNDGPKEKGGLRFCINSASLRFIPLEDMEKEGYGNLKSLVR